MDAQQRNCLIGAWGHSREEDAGGVRVYRPAGFPFPLSRGREWMEFKPGGELTFTDPGRDDRGQSVAGGWTVTDGGQLELRKHGEAAPRRFDVTACDGSVLKLRAI